MAPGQKELDAEASHKSELWEEFLNNYKKNSNQSQQTRAAKSKLYGQFGKGGASEGISMQKQLQLKQEFEV